MTYFNALLPIITRIHFPTENWSTPVKFGSCRMSAIRLLFSTTSKSDFKREPPSQQYNKWRYSWNKNREIITIYAHIQSHLCITFSAILIFCLPSIPILHLWSLSTQTGLTSFLSRSGQEVISAKREPAEQEGICVHK